MRAEGIPCRIVLANYSYGSRIPIVGRIGMTFIVELLLDEKIDLRGGVAGNSSEKEIGEVVAAIDATVFVVADARTGR